MSTLTISRTTATHTGPGTTPPARAETYYTLVPSPLGELLLVGRESAGSFALTSLSLPGQPGSAVTQPLWTADPAPFAAARRQLDAYFDGDREGFRLPLAPRGTAFRERVWRALDTVPYGRTVSYRQLAEAAGVPGSVRAVAGAVGANPLLVIRPCHRVIGSDGRLVGYAGGLDNKRRLLALEDATAA